MFEERSKQTKTDTMADFKKKLLASMSMWSVASQQIKDAYGFSAQLHSETVEQYCSTLIVTT